MAGQASGKPPQQGRGRGLERACSEDERYVGDINSPLKCNGFSGVNTSAETENQQSCPVNSVFEGAFKGPNEVQPVQNDIDEDFAEELCLEKECDSAAEVIKDSSSRVFLKDTNQQLRTSRADQDSSRASPTIVKARDRKSTRLNSSHNVASRMPSSA